MHPVEETVDLVIKDNPEIYQKALYDPAYIGDLRNKCVRQSGNRITPLIFSSAIARRIEADLEQMERKQNDTDN